MLTWSVPGHSCKLKKGGSKASAPFAWDTRANHHSRNTDVALLGWRLPKGRREFGLVRSDLHLIYPVNRKHTKCSPTRERARKRRRGEKRREERERERKRFC